MRIARCKDGKGGTLEEATMFNGNIAHMYLTTANVQLQHKFDQAFLTTIPRPDMHMMLPSNDDSTFQPADPGQ